MHTAKFIKQVLAATLGVFMLTGTTTAAELVDYSNVAFAPVGGLTSIPVGHADFCKRFPAQCRPNARVVEDVKLDVAKWKQLLSVNSHFNTTIVPETDEQLYHVPEFWTYPRGYGDCEDIALAKQRQLVADGWPVSTLLMTVARDAQGEGHAILMVRTDRGDFLLDNQDSTVLDWKNSPYHLLKRQSQANPAQWIAINDDRAALVLAAR